MHGRFHALQLGLIETDDSERHWARAGVVIVLPYGDHPEVADRIADYHALGIDEVILSGYPHVEEAYWFGEGVLPRLRDRGLLGAQASSPLHRASA